MSFLKPSKPESLYIGWMPKAPKEFRPFVRLVIVALLVVAYFVASFLVSNQKGFSSGVYERDKFTEMEGIIISNPFPALKTFYGKDIYGNPVAKTIPLVNKGKFGADSLLANVAREKKTDWSNTWVKLKGKLIYNRGITVMETWDGENSFLEMNPVTNDQQKQILPPIVEEMDSVTLQGEIIDPKCYLGVMKPGMGKPHTDCAIRCISGGIPPLLVIRNKKGEETFFILRGENNEPINDKVLYAIGQPVSVTGKLVRMDDWLVLKINPESGIIKQNAKN